jgi:class 3 adenylate cyclase
LPEPLASDLPAHIAEVKASDRRFIGLELRPTVPGRGRLDLVLNITPLKTAEKSTRGATIVVDDLTETRRLEAQRRLFERMVSPAVIAQIDPQQLQVGGRRSEITTLFADIRGFTSFSETSDPELLVEILNRHLAAAAEAILAEDGTIDKFMGDAVMAWFNAPIPQPDHTARAARAALGIRRAVQALHEELRPEQRLAFGVGVHFGEAVLGFIGTHKRLDYTAIGDSVNTARRLQENALAGQILLSRAAADRLEGARWGEGRSLRVEGKEKPIEVVELMDLT